MGISLLLTFLKRVLSLCLIYSTSRFAFYLYNLSNNESKQTILAFIEGIRFDVSALLYINIPFLFLIGVQYFIAHSKGFKRFINIIFYSLNIPFIILNNIDIIFYSFNLKRSTVDFFDFITYTDFIQVYLDYVFDYWAVTLLTFLQIGFLLRLKAIPKQKSKKIVAVPLLILTAAVVVLGLRGGTQLKPIKPINAGVISAYQYPELILNTPFTLLHSYKQKSILPLNYFNAVEDSLYTTQHNYAKDNFNKENVVIIILESFSKEFVGYYNKGQGFTPFLDSLIQTGLVIENAYANGIRSIEALPAITASIPSLMTEPFITSSYANNYYQSLASILSNEGYNTSFFHGGKKGTMGFYEFSKKAGFKEYYGMEEHNKYEDYDNSWGIYDEPFFEFFAKKLNQSATPFMSTFFSLSSHPPYQIPNHHKNRFQKGTLEIHESIGYTDFSLQSFFKHAQTTDWFRNTLFVITADHTSPLSDNKRYKNKVGRYAIPMLFWKADKSLSGSIETRSQQIDILPTVLDLLNYNKDFYSFGKSIFNEESWAISFLKNEYLMITDTAFIINKNEDYKIFKDVNFKENMPLNNDLVAKLKSVKQTFNNHMITNQMRVNEN